MTRVGGPTVSVCKLVSQSVATGFSGPAPQQGVCAQHGFDISAPAQILKIINILNCVELIGDTHREI